MDINISEAKAQLSKLINLAYHGEKIVICKNNLPLVDLVRHKPCLLYTSPSPRDRTRSRMPSSA